MFSFEPDMPVGRAKELIWSMWPSGGFSSFVVKVFGCVDVGLA